MKKEQQPVFQEGMWNILSPNISLRQYYAAKAMQSLISMDLKIINGQHSTVANVRRWAFVFADAMIEFEEKEGKE